jgi:hypothetical protein
MDQDQLNLVVFDRRVSVPPALLMEVAAGLEEGWEIADRYGYTSREWEEMEKQEGFQKQVAALRAEMKLSGVTFQRKAALLAEDLLEDVYRLAKNSKSIGDVQGAAKFFAQMGRLEPNAHEKGSSGGGNGGFSITFNFSGQQPQTIEAAQVVAPADAREDALRKLTNIMTAPEGIPDAD